MSAGAPWPQSACSDAARRFSPKKPSSPPSAYVASAVALQSGRCSLVLTSREAAAWTGLRQVAKLVARRSGRRAANDDDDDDDDEEEEEEEEEENNRRVDGVEDDAILKRFFDMTGAGWLAGKPFPTADGVMHTVPIAIATDAVAGT